MLIGPRYHEQWPRVCLGYREREPGRLQLRVPIQLDEDVCDIEVEEDDEQVAVCVLVCGSARDGEELIDCPYHAYLERPLADRRVIDLVSGRQLPLYTPSWLQEEPPQTPEASGSSSH
jgi:hypothetical protein